MVRGAAVGGGGPLRRLMTSADSRRVNRAGSPNGGFTYTEAGFWVQKYTKWENLKKLPSGRLKIGKKSGFRQILRRISPRGFSKLALVHWLTR